MRLGVAISISLLFCSTVAVHAQEMENLTQVLQSRNANVAPVLFQNKSYLDNSSFNASGFNAKTFQYTNGVIAKGFSTGAYAATNSWSGAFQFSTKEADLGSHSFLSSFLKLFKTGSAETKTAYESSKAFQASVYPEVRDFHGREKRGILQDRFDREGPAALMGKNPIQTDGALHVMTIEEVRNLLNKGN